MLDIDKLDSALLHHRGAYSTVRAMHEDELKHMQILCGQLSSCAAIILRRVQGKDDEEIESLESLIAVGRETLDSIEKTAATIRSLAKQRADLRPLAWPK